MLFHWTCYSPPINTSFKCNILSETRQQSEILGSLHVNLNYYVLCFNNISKTVNIYYIYVYLSTSKNNVILKENMYVYLRLSKFTLFYNYIIILQINIRLINNTVRYQHYRICYAFIFANIRIDLVKTSPIGTIFQQVDYSVLMFIVLSVE